VDTICRGRSGQGQGWQGILEATGLDMAEVIAEHVLGRALRRRKASDHMVRGRTTGAIHG
jgi:tetrahydromethanopterin:alpha-L-glutamate ligase